MLKKIILLFIVSVVFTLLPSRASWLSSVGSALKSVGSGITNTLGGVAQGVAQGVSSTLTGAAQLSYCRQIASIPGGTNSLAYQSQCGNMVFVCQQLRQTNPQIAIDPYCATVSGFGQFAGPWGASTGSFVPGVNTSSQSSPTNTDPSKVGWSVPAPPPYGFATGVGAYGVYPATAQGFGSLLASNVIGEFLGGSSSGGSVLGSLLGGNPYGGSPFGGAGGFGFPPFGAPGGPGGFAPPPFGAPGSPGGFAPPPFGAPGSPGGFAPPPGYGSGGSGGTYGRFHTYKRYNSPDYLD